MSQQCDLFSWETLDPGIQCQLMYKNTQNPNLAEIHRTCLVSITGFISSETIFGWLVWVLNGDQKVCHLNSTNSSSRCGLCSVLYGK